MACVVQLGVQPDSKTGRDSSQPAIAVLGEAASVHKAAHSGVHEAVPHCHFVPLRFLSAFCSPRWRPTKQTHKIEIFPIIFTSKCLLSKIEVLSYHIVIWFFKLCSQKHHMGYSKCLLKTWVTAKDDLFESCLNNKNHPVLKSCLFRVTLVWCSC